MSEILIFMAPAICMCVILVGICGYVGIHVIMREVIFIDIALAQIAALGVSFGIFLGFGIAYVLEGEFVKYEPSKLDLKWKIINLAIGMVILFVVFFGLEALKDEFDSVFYRYARYAIVGFIIGYVVPLLFVKLNKIP